LTSPVFPYQTGTAYTDTGLSDAGRWQTEIMAPVTGATVTGTENAFGTVDGQGRPAIVYPSAARTAAPTAYPIYTRKAKGIIVAINVTARAGTASMTVAIQALDHGSGNWVTLIVTASIASVSQTYLTYAPNAAVTANVSASGNLTDTIRILVTPADAQSLTYSIGADWVM
jgi:hypothetical protein